VNDAERRIVVTQGHSDQRRIVLDRGEKSVFIRGSERRIQVSINSGPVGAGGSGIGGYDVQISDIKTGDVIAFNGAGFINKRQAELTDGGNF
jgi:hypothetical protein